LHALLETHQKKKCSVLRSKKGALKKERKRTPDWATGDLLYEGGEPLSHRVGKGTLIEKESCHGSKRGAKTLSDGEDGMPLFCKNKGEGANVKKKVPDGAAYRWLEEKKKRGRMLVPQLKRKPRHSEVKQKTHAKKKGNEKLLERIKKSGLLPRGGEARALLSRQREEIQIRKGKIRLRHGAAQKKRAVGLVEGETYLPRALR